MGTDAVENKEASHLETGNIHSLYGNKISCWGYNWRSSNLVLKLISHLVENRWTKMQLVKSFMNFVVKPLVWNPAEDHQLLLWDWFHIRWTTDALVYQDTSCFVSTNLSCYQDNWIFQIQMIDCLVYKSVIQNENWDKSCDVILLLPNFEGQLWSKFVSQGDWQV